MPHTLAEGLRVGHIIYNIYYIYVFPKTILNMARRNRQAISMNKIILVDYLDSLGSRIKIPLLLILTALSKVIEPPWNLMVMGAALEVSRLSTMLPICRLMDSSI